MRDTEVTYRRGSPYPWVVRPLSRCQKWAVRAVVAVPTALLTACAVFGDPDAGGWGVVAGVWICAAPLLVFGPVLIEEGNRVEERGGRL